MGKKRMKKKGKALRWEIFICNIKSEDLLTPGLKWECLAGKRLPVGVIKAIPKNGIFFKSEYDDHTTELLDIEHTEAILTKFGLETPPFIEEVFDDLFILQTKCLDTIEIAVYEYGLLYKKWDAYTTKVIN
jgi:hypothetical protein